MLSLCGAAPLLYGSEDQQGQQEDAGDDLDRPAGVIGGRVEDEVNDVFTGGDGHAAKDVIGANNRDFVVIDIGVPAAVVVDFAEDGETGGACSKTVSHLIIVVVYQVDGVDQTSR